MKNFLALCLALILSASLLPMRVYAFDAPVIISETAILMDAETGQVLYQKEPEKRMYPASTTKIMTGLLVAESTQPWEVARVSYSAVDIDEWDSANIGLQENEEMDIDGLMYAMMMPSANDAANVLAEYVAGSKEAFADEMNKRAKTLGALSTHFANAHGLHEPDHYTTAYDLALITREAIKNESFIRYFGAAKLTIPPTNLNPYERPFTNYQYMLLDDNEYYYPDVTGGKVGYTHEAGHTMSTFAERDGRRLICVVMKSPNRIDKFEDTKKLLDFGFNEFMPVSVKSESFSSFEEKIVHGEYEVGVASYKGERDFTALLHRSLDASAIEISYSTVKITDSQNAGYAEFRAVTGNAAVPDLLGTKPLERSVVIYPPAGPEAIWDALTAAINEKPWLVPLMLFLFILAVFLAFAVTNKIAEAEIEKRRLKMLEEAQAAQAAAEAAEQARYDGPVPVVGKHFLTR